MKSILYLRRAIDENSHFHGRQSSVTPFWTMPQFTLAVMGVEGSIDAVIEKILDGTLKGGRGLCSPGQGKGYGIDQSTCKHKEE